MFFSFATQPQSRCYSFRFFSDTHKKETWSRCSLLAPQCKGSRIARIVGYEQHKRPTLNSIYTLLYITILRGICRCFEIDNPFEFARFLHCQSQSA